MKVVLYRYEDIVRLSSLIDTIPVAGFNQCKKIAEIGKILDSGEVKNQHEPIEKGEKDGKKE